MTSRRTFLKAVSACGGAAMFAPVSGAAAMPSGGPAFVIDTRLPDGADLAQRAGAAAHLVFEPRGEMIALLFDHAEELIARKQTIIGLTGYADLALARDFLRSRGHPVRHVRSLPEVRGPLADGHASAVDQALLASLIPQCQPSSRCRATTFLWLT